VKGRPAVGVTTDTAGVVHPVTLPLPAIDDTRTLVLRFGLVTRTTRSAFPDEFELGWSRLEVDAVAATVVSDCIDADVADPFLEPDTCAEKYANATPAETATTMVVVIATNRVRPIRRVTWSPSPPCP
jgi:hypothetical protein